MITAVYTKEENTHRLTVSGHANYSEKGSDIVCAGVSALVQSLMGWIENNPEYADYVDIDESRGAVVIECTGDGVEEVYYLTAIGLEQIADAYPDNVQIDIIGLAD